MKSLLIIASFVALAVGSPVHRDIVASPAILDFEPIAVGPAIVGTHPISVGPAIIGGEPISVGPAIIKPEPIAVSPVHVVEEAVNVPSGASHIELVLIFGNVSWRFLVPVPVRA